MKTIIAENYDELLNISKSICGATLYQDVLHDCILSVLEKDIKIRNWRTYFFVLIRNKLIDYTRNHNNKTLDLGELGESEMIHPENEHTLYHKVVSGQIMVELREEFGEEAQLFEEYYYTDTTMLGITKKFDISYGTAWNRITKMTKWLRDKVDN